MKVEVGYQIGPVNQPFPDNLLNVFVKGERCAVFVSLFVNDAYSWVILAL